MTDALIGGMPGVGKSVLVNYLIRQGRLAIDAELVPGMVLTRNRQGNLVDYDPTDPDFVPNHETHWDIDMVTQLVRRPRQEKYLYVAGMAHNFPEIIAKGLFTELVYLDADDETLRTRLALDTRQNPSGFGVKTSHPNQINDTLAISPYAREMAKEFGATILDTTGRTPEEVGAMVIRAVEGSE